MDKNKTSTDVIYKFHLIITSCIVTFCIFISLLMYIKKNKPKILGDITTQTQVYGCRFDFIAKPEHRAVNNWSTNIDVEIYDNTNTNLLGKYSVITNNFGENSTDLCDDFGTPIHLNAGNYYFYLKGKSHVSKEYPNIYAFAKALTTIDFSTGNNFLKAGDTNHPRDDEINSLDITHLIRTLNKSKGIDADYNEDYDLNLDDQINLDDTDIIISNFYTLGENIH